MASAFAPLWQSPLDMSTLVSSSALREEVGSPERPTSRRTVEDQ